MRRVAVTARGPHGSARRTTHTIDHVALMDRVWARVKDKRVLGLVKTFLKAGILTELGDHKDTWTGTPQGGILSPLLANIALSALDEHLHEPWKPGGTMSTNAGRVRRRAKGLPTWRVIRYADDCVTRTRGRFDVEGRARRAVLCQRWRKVLRDRPAGGGLKLPQAAPVKRFSSPSSGQREGQPAAAEVDHGDDGCGGVVAVAAVVDQPDL